MKDTLENRLNKEQLQVLQGLDSPARIQAFLDTCLYVAEY
jgi:hypothetical protein